MGGESERQNEKTYTRNQTQPHEYHSIPCDGKWIKMSYKRARKILHSNGIEYVRIHHDKKQIVMNQVITLYGRRIETEQRLAQAKLRTR